MRPARGRVQTADRQDGIEQIRERPAGYLLRQNTTTSVCREAQTSRHRKVTRGFECVVCKEIGPRGADHSVTFASGPKAEQHSLILRSIKCQNAREKHSESK